MPYMVKPSTCKKCKSKVSHLKPFDGGICDECLVIKFKNGFTLKEAKKQMCDCCHKDLEQLYARSQN